MNKEERGQLLRERFKACGGNIILRRDPRPKKEPRVYRNRFCFGPLNSFTQCNWIGRPDEKPETELRPMRTKKLSALTRIADKWRAAPSARNQPLEK